MYCAALLGLKLTFLFQYYRVLAVFALPLPALWKLTTPRSQKIMLIGIFSLGFL